MLNHNQILRNITGQMNCFLQQITFERKIRERWDSMDENRFKTHIMDLVILLQGTEPGKGKIVTSWWESLETPLH